MITRMLLLVSLSVMLVGSPVEWKSFTPKEGGFSVSFPGTPVEFNQSVKTHTGFVNVKLYVVEPKKGEGQYVASWSEYPDTTFKAGSDDKRLENARDGAVASLKGTLRSSKAIKLGDYPGLDLLIEAKDKAMARTRIYAVKTKLYQLMVVGPPKMVASKETEQFLESFKLVK